MATIIDADQLPAFLASIEDDFYDAATHAAEPLRQVAAHMAGGMAEHILKSVNPDGGSYPPLKRKRPAGHNPHSRPLIDTGALIQSLHSGQDHIEDVEDEYVTVGTSDPKAAFHEYGTQRIPVRSFAGITPEVEEKTGELIADHIVRKMTK